MQSSECFSDRTLLADADVAAYRSDGYFLVRRPIFPRADFEALSARFEDLLARYGVDDLNQPHVRDPQLFEFLLADAVLDLVEPIIGPDIGLWSSHFISKAPRVGHATPWHEDSAYWEGRVSRMDQIVTVWLAIDETDVANGAMGVIPGSHLSDNHQYETVTRVGGVFDRQIEPASLDLNDAVIFSLKPNECSLHDARIVHGADANKSSRRRAGYTMRYFATSTRVIPERNPEHPVWLARGRDLGGNRFAALP